MRRLFYHVYWILKYVHQFFIIIIHMSRSKLEDAFTLLIITFPLSYYIQAKIVDSVLSLCRTAVLDTRPASENTSALCLLRRGPVAVINAACLKSLKFVVRLPLWNLSFKETTVSSRSEWFSIVWSIRDRDVACSISQRQCSGGKCILIFPPSA